MNKLYVDLDGVLADFDTEYYRLFRAPVDRTKGDRPDMWHRIAAKENFFADMRPMPDMDLLWEYVSPWKPTIITGCPSQVLSAASQKREWVATWLGHTVPVICCKSKDKSQHAEVGDVIIDDWNKYKHLWIGVGGRWITHISAAQSIEDLKRLGF